MSFFIGLVFSTISYSFTPKEESDLLKNILREKEEAYRAEINYYKKLFSKKSERNLEDSETIGRNIIKDLQELWKNGGAIDFFASTEKTGKDEFEKKAKKFKNGLNSFLSKNLFTDLNIEKPTEKTIESMSLVEEDIKEKKEEGFLQMGLPPTEDLEVPVGVIEGEQLPPPSATPTIPPVSLSKPMWEAPPIPSPEISTLPSAPMPMPPVDLSAMPAPPPVPPTMDEVSISPVLVTPALEALPPPAIMPTPPVMGEISAPTVMLPPPGM
ncbi:hypothetical protein ACFLYH_03130 [Candidatus Dependentiae bacterium]